jgi:proteasome assembly chaperone (PAC2) family protein
VSSERPLVEIIQDPQLVDPVMIVGLEGWIDSGMGASTAMSALLSASDAQTVAEFDTDRLLDHRSRRPVVHLVNGLITDLTWPGIELRAGTDAAGNDVLFLLGAEPDFEWRAFCDAVIDLAQGFDVRMVVELGAYPAPVAHTRPTALSVTTSSTELSDTLHGYVRGTLDVPGGIHSVLDVEANAAGIPAVGIWAQVPHYVAAMPYPPASMALLEGLNSIAGVHFEPGELDSDSRATRIRLDELVAANPQHQTMVAQLEQMMDEGLGGPDDAPTFGFDRIPSGDELAAELQQYLRDRPDDPA